ncbi:hypothetical protein PV682_43320 [Streptomyces niveiscabiei]|uniref:hypothetical protein n=1 Tax=Streptomyces niveiscabiei TaxID=164115 RepID=UPI0029A848BB|nr:hypothetical protein [Streptomyces niveiscabiei]MDX3388222.1 hypothetical protein [Streptomyces niveiscabiei]
MKVTVAIAPGRCTMRICTWAFAYLPVLPVTANCSSRSGAFPESRAVPEVVILPPGRSWSRRLGGARPGVGGDADEAAGARLAAGEGAGPDARFPERGVRGG